DPALERAHGLDRKLSPRRHAEVGVLPTHDLDEEASARIARHDGRSALAAAKETRARVEAQIRTRLLRSRRVALVAMLDEERPDLVLEEGDVLGARLGGCAEDRRRLEREPDGEDRRRDDEEANGALGEEVAHPERDPRWTVDLETVSRLTEAGSTRKRPRGKGSIEAQ